MVVHSLKHSPIRNGSLLKKQRNNNNNDGFTSNQGIIIGTTIGTTSALVKGSSKSPMLVGGSLHDQ